MEQKEKVLVTGGTGFVGTHILLQLLQKGYQVKTTMRSLRNRDKLIDTLRKNGISSFDNLSFIEAELTNDGNWAEAMEGCNYVLSVASPVFLETPKDEDEAMRPAIEGILRVLKFAREAGVKRVVMTSNFGAVGFSQTDKRRDTTEADWTDPDLKGLSAYEKSKTLAEKAAWDFIKNEGGNLEFTTINPVAIFGPSLDDHVSGSFEMLRTLLDGSMKAIPQIPLNIVDVRDVADLHIRAMLTQEASGQRFIATANGQISWPEIAKLIKTQMPDVAEKVSLKTVPNWLLHLGGLFNERARMGSMFLRMNRNVSNAKARKILNWQPVATQEAAILASVQSLVKFNLVNREK